MEVYSKAAQESAIDLSSVIMLLELGFLGLCKVKMYLCNEPRLHVACTLRQLTRKIIVRKKLTQVDAWNEDDVPGEDDVAALQCVLGLLDEAAGLIVLRAPVAIERRGIHP